MHQESHKDKKNYIHQESHKEEKTDISFKTIDFSILLRSLAF